MDPAEGKIVLTKDEFNKIFTGIVVELIPRSKIVSMPKEKSIYKLFFNLQRNRER